MLRLSTDIKYVKRDCDKKESGLAARGEAEGALVTRVRAAESVEFVESVEAAASAVEMVGFASEAGVFQEATAAATIAATTPHSAADPPVEQYSIRTADDTAR